MSLSKLKADLRAKIIPGKAEAHHRFFKTARGQYGEGDVFIGVKVPDQRIIAKRYKDLSQKDLQTLLNSKIHEHRLTALFILDLQYQKADNKETIAKFYLKNLKAVNNWDLVDDSAPKILGKYLLNKERKILYKLAKSKNLWEKRIAIITTYTFIKNGQFEDTLKIAEILLNDKHDLIHKAVGWMLREVGNRDLRTEEKFLDKYHKTMPRTMLRYAIEKFNKERKKHYMRK